MTDDFQNLLSEAIMQEANSMVNTGSIPPCTLAEVHRRINSDIVDREIFSKMDSRLTSVETDTRSSAEGSGASAS